MPIGKGFRENHPSRHPSRHPSHDLSHHPSRHFWRLQILTKY